MQLRRFKRKDYDRDYLQQDSLSDVLQLIVNAAYVPPEDMFKCFIFDKNIEMSRSDLSCVFFGATLLPLVLTSKHLLRVATQVFRMKKFPRHPTLRLNRSVCAVYSIMGYKNLLNWAISLGMEPCSISANACANGDTSFIRWLLTSHSSVEMFQSDSWCCPSACTNGRLDALKLLVEELGLKLSAECYSEAIEFGHVHILEYLLEKKCDMDPKAYARAAYCKQIQVLEFLRRNAIECTYDPLGPAASVGCIKTLEWLCEHGFRLGPTTARYAIRHKHNHVLDWILDKNTPVDKESVLCCIEYRNLDALYTLHRRRNQLFRSITVHLHLEYMQSFSEPFYDPIREDILGLFAIERGSIDYYSEGDDHDHDHDHDHDREY